MNLSQSLASSSKTAYAASTGTSCAAIATKSTQTKAYAGSLASGIFIEAGCRQFAACPKAAGGVAIGITAKAACTAKAAIAACCQAAGA